MERPYHALDPDEMKRWDAAMRRADELRERFGENEDAARRTEELRERADDDAEDADPVAHHDPQGAMPERMRE